MANVKANVNVKIDADVKERAINFLHRMGLDQTTAIDMFFRQIIAEKRLPFQPSVKTSLDERLEEAIWKSNPKRIDVDFDKDGNIFIDKDVHPELYDWAVNG